jgi:hypothetical protein
MGWTPASWSGSRNSLNLCLAFCFFGNGVVVIVSAADIVVVGGVVVVVDDAVGFNRLPTSD